MKKLFKIFGLVLIICLVVCGCGKDNKGEEGEGGSSKENAQKQVEGKLTATEVGFFNGEFKERTVVLKVENGNKKPVYVNVSFEMYDDAGNMLYNKEIYVRVGANSSAYAVAIRDAEEADFTSYKYTLKNMDETLDDYEKIYSGINYTYNDNGRHVTVTYTNNGKRTTTVYGLVMYYKKNNLVAVVEATEYNLMPTSTRDVEVRYPIETVTKKISFDRFEVVLNEVSTEL